ncbi:MMPL family transporter [Plantactinospora sp. KLBMP9567]|uniref:MMPL family transporter n=1 Tax=Plantactinospora sp. KLBMP9567 TaxID=3085900 RepID=UPI0029810BEF|nr:MMPL family transporter [Plantactinospora sp. KLBMP9567]MDW5323369.1 MMPL family transporter [Plantactinospora sp. KLBMP9567]
MPTEPTPADRPDGEVPDGTGTAVAGSTGPAGAGLFARVAGWAYRRRWAALLTWVVVLVGLAVAAQAVGTDYHNDHSLPGTESQATTDTLREHGSRQTAGSFQIVLHQPRGIDTAEVRQRVEPMLGQVRGMASVAELTSPYDDRGAVSADGTIGYATVTLDRPSEEVPADDVRAVIEAARAAAGDGLRVELAGDPVRAAEESEGGPAEGAGLLAALVILVILFGSLLAAAMPIGIAIFAVGSTLSLVVLASHVATVADYTAPLMALVGLGVGIDYALLVFSRFRSELLHGADRATATRIALDSAGRTVFFAACTVVIALLGLIVLGLGSLQGVAVAVALTVLVTMLASLTLLPALLAIVGGRVERAIRRRAERAKRAEGAVWRRWSGFVQRRPWLALLLPTALLVLLAVPALDMRLGFADAGSDAPTSTSRQAYDLISTGFGPGQNGPLVVAVEGGQPAATEVGGALAGVEGVASVTPPFPAPDGQLHTLLLFPTSAPQDAATMDLVDRLRTEVLPPVERSTGVRVSIGGGTAAAVDFADAISDRLPLFVVVVVGLSALLLVLVFRSLLIPVKAAVLNLLSVAAALGVITYVFQYGNLGVQPGPVEAFVPVLIFAIVFGLSMDYEVFLVSRMHEHWERHRDAEGAIREGLATTGRVVTAAAAIMIVVFSAFLFDPGRMLQQFGLGLAVAIFVDGFVIRCLILPAVMQLFGARAWWLPSWLGRWLPRVALERPEAATPVTAGAPRSTLV